MSAASRCAYALATILSVFAVGSVFTAAQARVGVTSETDGDPLGKPPSASERVLRVGIDIQADETITTRANDRAHLVFLDGTALTISSNSQIKVDRFVYDPQKRSGEISISVAAGVFRLVGGKISKNTPVTITTPSSTIGIRGGVGLFTVEPGQTTAQFLFGTSMQVTANGQSQTALRAGSEIRTALGGAPSAPALIPPGGVAKAMQALEAQHGASTPRTASGTGEGSPDESARRSGFSDQNSGRGTGGQIAGGRVEALADRINSNLQQPRTAPPTAPAVAALLPTPVLPPAPILLSAAPPPLNPVCFDPPWRHHRSDHDRPGERGGDRGGDRRGDRR